MKRAQRCLNRRALNTAQKRKRAVFKTESNLLYSVNYTLDQIVILTSANGENEYKNKQMKTKKSLLLFFSLFNCKNVIIKISL